MKKIINLTSILVVLSCIFVSSCKKEEDAGSGQIDFTLNLEDAQSSLKSARVSATAAYVVVTIEDLNGKVIKNSEKLELVNMNGSYITQPVSLVSGSYKLSRFLVLDSNSNVLYASPVKGSSKAYLVQQPLPVAFEAHKDAVTKLVPEVLSASETSPENFGYSTFSFSVTETFNFLVGAFIYNNDLKNYQLTTASVTILGGTTPVYSGELSAKTTGTNTGVYDSLGVTNKITLPGSYSKYTITISKPGYKTYSKTFVKEELKLYFRSIEKGPLIVILEAEPVEVSDFYIRGNFGNEYLSYSAIQIPGRQCTYYNTCVETRCTNYFHFFAYENTVVTSKQIGLYISSNDLDNVFDLDNVTLPYTIDITNAKVFATLAYNGYGSITRGSSLKVTIESRANDIIYGKFSGEIKSDAGVTMTVNNGEFHGKFNRIVQSF